MHSTIYALMYSTIGDLYLPPNALHCWGSFYFGDLYLRPNALHSTVGVGDLYLLMP